MKFHLSRPDGRNVFTACGPGYVAVNGVSYRSSVIVTTEQVLPWDLSTSDTLTEAVFAYLARFPVEILLLGTGEALRFPHPRLSQPVREARIGLEVMDTCAACRTYNILAAEGRRVAAALLIT